MKRTENKKYLTPECHEAAFLPEPLMIVTGSGTAGNYNSDDDINYDDEF